jgi:low molecular weight phosphotyrosine protein phosphatase
LLIKRDPKHKVPIKHQAQQISKQHFYDFDYILASDGSNLSSLERVKPKDATAEVRLWGSYDDNQAIRDPYYDGGKASI